MPDTTEPSSLPNEPSLSMTTASSETLLVRLQALEKAQELFRGDMVRVPTNVDRSTTQLRELLESKMESLSSVLGQRVTELTHHLKRVEESVDARPQEMGHEIGHLRELLRSEAKRLEDVSDQRFQRIDAGLTERDKRAEQLGQANDKALVAALAAQKEAAGEAQKSSALAIAKSEAATSESIKQGQTLNQTGLNSLILQVNDLKSRMDKGEGSVSQKSESSGNLLAVIAIGVAMVAALSSVVGIFLKVAH